MHVAAIRPGATIIVAISSVSQGFVLAAEDEFEEFLVSQSLL